MIAHINKTSFTIPLTLEDELCCEFTTDNGKLISFVIEYNAVINGIKQTVSRVDTHDGNAHKHIFYKKRKKDGRRIILSNSVDDYGHYYNEEFRYLQRNFNKIKDNYLNN